MNYKLSRKIKQYFPILWQPCLLQQIVEKLGIGCIRISWKLIYLFIITLVYNSIFDFFFKKIDMWLVQLIFLFFSTKTWTLLSLTLEFHIFKTQLVPNLMEHSLNSISWWFGSHGSKVMEEIKVHFKLGDSGVIKNVNSYQCSNMQKKCQLTRWHGSLHGKLTFTLTFYVNTKIR